MSEASGPLNPGGAVGRKGGQEFTSGSIPKQLLAFSLPMLVGSTLQTAYNLVNAYWVGKGLGTQALAAITVSFPVFFLLMAISGGISQASAILISQSFGAGDQQKVRRIMHNSILMNLFVAVGCLAAGVFGIEFLLRMMKTPEEVFPLALGYMRIFVWTIPGVFGLFLLGSALRGVGDSRTPVLFQAAGLVLNTVLDPVLMFGWMGMPRLGLNGAAVVTVLTPILSCLGMTWYLLRVGHLVAPDLRGFAFDRKLCSLILKIGVPTMIQQALVSLGMVILLGLVNGFGTVAAAAFGTAMRIDQFAVLPAMTISMAVASMAGQNIGAGKFDRVRRIFWWALGIGCGLTGIATFLAVVFPENVVRLFVDDPQVVSMGVSYLRIVGPGYLLFTIMFVGNGVINGSGHTLMTTFISMVASWFVRLPLAAFLSTRMGRVEGIWWAIMAGFATGMAISVLYFLSGKWQKPVASGK